MPIEAKDLMIGNYVLLPSGKYGLVNFISESDVGVRIELESYRVGWELLEPIPLSKELLIKIGFENMMGSKFYLLNNFEIKLEEDHFSYDTFTGRKVKINYMHTLQNAYKILTGEHLNITL